MPEIVHTAAELRELIGQEIGLGKWFTVEQSLVDAYADVSGDHQYIHVDPERAKETPYKGTIAHGFLTLSLFPKLSTDRGGVQIDLGATMLLNYGLNKLRFPGPVPVGKRIRLRSKLLSVDEGPNYVQTVTEQTVEVEGQERPGMVAEYVTRAYF